MPRTLPRRTTHGSLRRTHDEDTQIQGVTLDAWTTCPWAQHGVQVDALDTLQVLRVRTRNSTYQLARTGDDAGDVLVRGGQYFPDWTPVHLAGASLGRGCLKRHGIYVGFRMEFYWRGRRVVTSPVLSIVREGPPLTDAPASSTAVS